MKKILIIDDQRDVLALLEKILREVGYEVTTVQSIPTLSDILKGGFDLVILDLIMPGVAGYTLGREIVANRSGPTPRVVLISGRNEDILKQKAKDIGADGWLVKPFRADEVLAVVNSLFS